jgi:GTP cyclohydrolase IB
MPATTDPLEDVQNHRDGRRVALDRVGVTDLRFPIVVLDRANRTQPTVGTVSMSVRLPHDFKGTHMSRFVEVLAGHRGELTMHSMPRLVRELRRVLEAEAARVEVAFPYFIERVAPVSGARAPMDFPCTFAAESDGDRDDFVLGVSVPVTSLCPCSRAISDYGAHNQRGTISIRVRGVVAHDGTPAFVWIEDLVEIAERSASAPVYPLLKRPDERHLTMLAYDHPAFVEDMVRDVAVAMMDDQRVAWFHVRAVNHESIHNHSAVAELRWRRAAQPGAA